MTLGVKVIKSAPTLPSLARILMHWDVGYAPEYTKVFITIDYNIQTFQFGEDLPKDSNLAAAVAFNTPASERSTNNRYRVNNKK